ncbi:hypothetical protein O181_032851 [Austropuccinia psidii MF-1]|uniref:Reverse transcriptase n=1 Tax=Austropuccinia psidii MF-1 TaxID=1389203 RepID=A0A9Q3H6I7_9BASI|nr:hypothetical protein [Austropuccinia psidii MF-1]
MLMYKARSPSQYQDGDNMSYSEKEPLKKLPQASSWPRFSGTAEYNHMELIDYIDGLFIDVPSIPDYWITARLNKAFEGYASIWYTEMKEIHGRREWLWWKSQIIQKYSNGTWIWQMTKDPYAWCLRQSKRLKAIEMRNHKLLTQMPGDQEHAVKSRCNQNCTLDEIANTFQDLRKRTNIGKYIPYKSHHYANNCPKAKKKVYDIDKVPEDKSPTADSESDSMGDAIREQSDEEQAPRGNPARNPDAQTFLVTPTKGMAYIHGTATKMTVCIDNAQHPLIIDSGAHCSIVARNYLDNHFPNWDKQLLPTKAKNFKKCFREDDFNWENYQRDDYTPQGGHITIGTNKEKGISLHIYQISAQDPVEELLNEFREGQFSTTLASKHKLSFLKILRKNRQAFSIGEQPLCKIRGHDIELYLDVERPYPPMLRGPPYPESMETRKEIKKHINELLDMNVIRKIGNNEIVDITTPVLITWNDGKARLCGDFRALNNYTKADRYPIPRIPHALDKLAKAKYITQMDCMKVFNQNGVKPNSMKLLRMICHMGIYEYTRMLFGIKNAPAHIQTMMDTIFQEEISEGWMVVYIDEIIIHSDTWEDHVQYIDTVLKLLAVGHKVSGLSLAIDQNKVGAVLNFAHITSSLYKLCSKDVGFEITKERRDAYERIKNGLTNAPELILPYFELLFQLYIDEACSQGLVAALHQRQILDGEPREGVICYISRQLKDSEARSGATQTEWLILVWALEKLHYYFEGTVFEVYTDCTALKSLMNMKTTKRHMFRWQIAIQEYRGNMTIIYNEVKSRTNADGHRIMSKATQLMTL